MKMVLQSGCALRTCCAPCQSISRITSWPGVAQRFHLRAAGAVEVVEHLRVFEEFARVAAAA